MANPIITVTEHTPTPSPDYLRRQVELNGSVVVFSTQLQNFLRGQWIVNWMR